MDFQRRDVGTGRQIGGAQVSPNWIAKPELARTQQCGKEL
jgi:hypothetical protein